MLDDFREWLSDNLRYILLGLAILVKVVAVALLAAVLLALALRTDVTPRVRVGQFLLICGTAAAVSWPT